MAKPLEKVQLDLNNPVFQTGFFELQEAELAQAAKTLKKINSMTWDQVYADHGLKWEAITSGPKALSGGPVYSLRLNQALRATAYRDGGFMRLLTVAPDHDSTYGKK